MSFIKRLLPTMVRALLIAVASLTGGGIASADAINPGFDLFATTFANADLSGAGLGIVSFQGVPLQPSNLGNTDTIVQRTGSLPPGGIGPIPIELVALELKSIQPVIPWPSTSFRQHSRPRNQPVLL
jgi:hypothetical protein